MYYQGPQSNIDKQVLELRETVKYHRHWARRLNFVGWATFGAAIATHVTSGEAGLPWLAFLLMTAACWAWRYYEEGKERETREELWEYCRESVQKLHKWEGKQSDD